MSQLHTHPPTLWWFPGFLDTMEEPIVHSLFSLREVAATAWTSSDAVLGNATSTVLRNKQGWNGLFVFRVTAINQFGSSESSEMPVTLGNRL